jgi:transcriptional regulator with XRE-family HTH domain
MIIFVCNTKYYKLILKYYVVKGVNLRLGKKSKLTDDRMIDSICTSDERLEDFLMEIGRRLKKERIKKGYSVSELSQLSGVAATIIYRIESSANSVGLRSLLRLMWSLNVSPAQLIPFDEYAHSKTFGDVIEEMTSNLSPKQKQYLLKVIDEVERTGEANLE